MVDICKACQRRRCGEILQVNILDDVENPVITAYLGDHISGGILWSNLNIILDLIADYIELVEATMEVM